MKKLTTKLKELAVSLAGTLKLSIELVIIILGNLFMLFKKINSKIDDERAWRRILLRVMFWIVVIPVLLMLLFPPPARSLDELKFSPELPSNPVRQIEVGIEGEYLEDGTDLNKLAYAVAMHETKNCKADRGSALLNNCFGIMQWSNGLRHFKEYERPEDSYKDFKRIWKDYYKRYPDTWLARRYSGDDRASEWLINVNNFYWYE